MNRSVVIAVLLLGMASSGRADVIAFGDSLTDTGNFYGLTGFPLAPPDFAGRSSYGPLWVEHLASRLGQPLQNHAFVGSRTSGDSPYTIPGFTRDITQQAQFFAANHVVQPGDVFAVWGGANDFYFGLTGQSDYVAPDQVVANLSNIIQILAASGAKEFVVPNLPPLGQTPFFLELQPPDVAAALIAALDAHATLFNALLPTALADLEANSGIEIHLLDVDRLFQAILADPAAFGLANVTESATFYHPVNGFGLALKPDDPSTYLFFDSVHPTAGIHQMLGEQAAQQVVPEPATFIVWATLGMTACGLSWARRRRAVSQRG
jgi:phospholipase/lecithinase/hemolysin